MKVGVGFVLPSADAEVASGMELLTGDTNILNVALVLQYVIRDPTDFLFQIKDTSAFVETVAEAVLTETVAGMPIDEVLTRGRVAVQERIKEQTQEILNRRRSGISIVSASIMAMTLDRSVAQAFQDVADAMADREKMINEARAYQSNLIPKARGDARTTTERGRGLQAAAHRRGRWRSEPFHGAPEGVREGARRDQNQALSGGHGEGSGESAALRHRFGQRARAATS